MGKRNSGKPRAKREKAISPSVKGHNVPQAKVQKFLDQYRRGADANLEKSALQLAKRYPKDKVSWLILGTVLRDLRKLTGALSAFNSAVMLDDQDSEAHLSAGMLSLELGDAFKAGRSLERAVELDPGSALAHYSLAVAREQSGDFDLAEESYRDAIAQDIRFAQAHNNLGAILERSENFEEAEEHYKQAILSDHNYAEPHSNLGMRRLARGDYSSALRCFVNSSELMRGKRISHPNPIEAFETASRAKILHDIEQLEFLVAESVLSKDGWLGAAIEKLRALLEGVSWPSETGVVRLAPEHLIGLDAFYNRLMHREQAREVRPSALNQAMDWKKVCDSYLNHDFGITVVDDFLSELALETLRSFLLKSTIWFHVKKGGYLGAHINEGLACPLLFQIAEELRAQLPRVLKDYPLYHVWAYKYDSRAVQDAHNLSGIKTHADFAAVNVNFWVTIDEANLDPSSGGLIVHHVEAPLDWSFDEFNSDDTMIAEHVQAAQTGKTVIPYRENRAVIFNSDLFHETDRFEFGEAYHHRRINVTMLFGDRQQN